MLNLTSLLHRALLALAFVAGTAVAGPTYHVSIDTNGYSGDGVLALAFAGIAGGPAATATVTHLTGTLGTGSVTGDATGGAPGPISLFNASGNDFYFGDVSYGGLLAFDVNFSGDWETSSSLDGSMFSVFLANADFSALYGNPDGSVVDFALASNTNEAAANVTFLVNGGDVTVTDAAAVPEASQWAIFITGLGLMSWTLRRRQPR
jgi:hypothetical protein